VAALTFILSMAPSHQAYCLLKAFHKLNQGTITPFPCLFLVKIHSCLFILLLS